MNTQIKSLLEKYSHIEFICKKDKELFLKFIDSLLNSVKNKERLDDLIHIIEYNFNKF